MSQPVPAVLLLWAVWLLGQGCGLDCGYGCRSAARTPTETTNKTQHKHNVKSFNSVYGTAASTQECDVGGVAYLPGFVRVFHSGRLFYVDFCRIHTSRLFRKRGEKQKITSRSTQNQIINSFGCLRAANFTAVMSFG